jgi:hypothetical protein
MWLLSHSTVQEFAVTSGAVNLASVLFAWRSLRRPAAVVEPSPI